MTAPQPAPAAADARGVVVDAASFRRLVDACERQRAATSMFLEATQGSESEDAAQDASELALSDLVYAAQALIATARALPTAAGAVDSGALAAAEPPGLAPVTLVGALVGWAMSYERERPADDEDEGEAARTARNNLEACRRAVLNALASATPAVPAPDRADFDRLLYTVVNTAACHALAKKRDEPGYRAKVNAVITDLTRLVFPDAPAPAPDAAGEAVRDG